MEDPATAAKGYQQLLDEANANTIVILENIKKEQEQYIKQLEDRNNQLRLELDYAHKRIKELIQQDEP